MKVIITHPVRTETDLLQAGRVVDVPTKQAEQWIKNGWAFEIPEVKPKRKKEEE